MAVGRVIFCKVSQLKKAYPLISVTVFGIVIDANAVQFIKQRVGILFN